jgi:hypothetical protein
MLRRQIVMLAAAMGLPALARAQQTQAPPAAPAPAAPMQMQMPATAAAPEPGKRSPGKKDAYCYIGWPNDGEVLHSTHFKVWFGLRNFGVAPAGTDFPDTGHHHLLIDTDLPSDLSMPIPNDRNHLHYGLGQTEAIVELEPGRHTLQLLMGDANHVPHDPPVMSRKITISVQA